MLISHFILAILWVAYCVLHSVLASTTVKHRLQRRMRSGFRFYRIGYTIFSFLALVAILIYQFSIRTTFIFNPSIIIKSIAVILMALGSGIMLLMIWKYFMQLSGVRWLSHEDVKSKLEVRGLHRYVRHPLYLGTFVFIWGWFILSPSISFLISSSIITIYTLIALRFEEQKLIEEFGDDYIQYRKKVPSLIPKL